MLHQWKFSIQEGEEQGSTKVFTKNTEIVRRSVVCSNKTGVCFGFSVACIGYCR